MEQGDTKQQPWSLWVIEPPLLTDTATAHKAINESNKKSLMRTDVSALKQNLSSVVQHDVALRYLSPETKDVHISERETESLPDKHTNISQQSPDQRFNLKTSSSLPETTQRNDSSRSVSGMRPRPSFDEAPKLLSKTSYIESETPVNSPNHEFGLPPLMSAREKDTPNVKWEQIQQLRVDVWSSRSFIHQIRASLRQQQYLKSDADDMLIGRLRIQELGGNFAYPSLPSHGQKSLDQLRQEAQDARDVYGPLEDKCNNLEDLLSAKEFRLSQLEEVFYSQNVAPVPEVDSEKITPLSEQYHESPRRDWREDAFEDITDIQYHPLVTQYLSKLGDLDLLQERLDNLMDEKESLEIERESRLRFGLALAPEDQIWLDGSQYEHDSLLNQIRNLENETEHLRQICLEKGLVDEDDEPTTFQDQEEDSFKEDKEVYPGDQISEFTKFPLLLPHPGIAQDGMEFESYNPMPDATSDLTTTRINQWMLHRLRMSPLDVNLLASTFEDTIGKVDRTWQHSVLSMWYNDGTVKATPGSHTHSGSLITEEGGPTSGSAPMQSMLSPVFNDFDFNFNLHTALSETDSSVDTETAIPRGRPPFLPPQKPLFWNGE